MEEKIDYFIEQTNARLEKIDLKLDQLLSFKWKIIGGSVMFSLFLTMLVNIFFQGGIT